jgi:hypothetical protein
MTQPAPITPGPTPFTFLVAEARTGDGKALVMVEVHSVTGVQRLFSSPEDAERMAEHWLQAARRARTGLIVPAPAAVPVAANGKALPPGMGE